ncbi:MAG TPA: pilus assembly protein PilP [Deltaproteobacteria bacterium]|nr:pilus assembly protein PilP [Deltaproteobacteria bacterium]
MNRMTAIIVLLVCVLGLAGCPSKTEEKAAGTSPAAKAPTKEIQQIKPVMVTEEKPKPEYTVIGTRDPFQPYMIAKPEEMGGTGVDPLQRLMLSQVELVGVIMGKEPKALIQDTANMGYIIKEGTLIGENSGIVTDIQATGVTIKQHFKDYMGRVNTREIVLSLRKGEGER